MQPADRPMSAEDKPEDLCRCGSGLTYRDCHKEIIEAQPEEVLAVARRQYARRWAGNSSFYESQGIYKNLAYHLSQHTKPSRILDIGCGRGEGLVALQAILSKSRNCLIGIDENPECLNAAAVRLSLQPPHERLERVSAGGRNYDLAVRPGLLPPPSSISLLQSDVRRPDRELDAFLSAAGPFDAVTLWFNGIHPARQFDIEIQASQLNDDRQVRMAIELDAAEIAHHFMQPGGILHIASRGASESEASCRAEIEPEMELLAKESGLFLSNLSFFKYSEPISGERIIIGQPGEDLSDLKSFVASAIFVVR